METLLPANEPKTARRRAVLSVLVALCGVVCVWLAGRRFLGTHSFEWAARKKANGDFQNAIDLYERAVSFDPSLYYAYGEIAQCKLTTTIPSPDLGEIRGLMQKALAQAPHDEYLRLNYALLLEMFGKVDLALAELGRSKASNPNLRPAYLEAARMMAGAGKHDEALREYDEWLARSPNDVDALRNSAVILQSQGNIKEARERWQKILQIDPSFAPARASLDATPSK